MVVRVPFDDLAIDITIRVYADATNFSDATISLPGGIFSIPEAFVVPYDQFTDTGSGADFTNVTAIELFQLDPSAPAVDLQIEYIGTIGPMQVDFPNLELGVQIEKSTNGEDADEPTGPRLPVGDTAVFTYQVINTGNVPLAQVSVTDDNGSIMDLDSFFIMYPDAEFCITTRESHDWCAASIPIEQLTDNGIESLLQPCCVAPRNPVAANRFQDIIANVMAAAATCPAFEESQAAQRAASELLDLLRPIPVQRRTTTRQNSGRPKITRDEIIHRSLAILEEHRSEHPSVAEFASTCGVSERTLRTVFREYFGRGPSRFLQLRQLHDVRRALRSADPDDVNVTQIMAAHGVWTHGRFARRYSNLFGELPSVTLHSTASN